MNISNFPRNRPTAPGHLHRVSFLGTGISTNTSCVYARLFFSGRSFLSCQRHYLLTNVGIPVLTKVVPIADLSNVGHVTRLSKNAYFPTELLGTLGHTNSGPSTVRRMNVRCTSDRYTRLLSSSISNVRFCALGRDQTAQRVCEGLKLGSSLRLLRRNRSGWGTS